MWVLRVRRVLDPIRSGRGTTTVCVLLGENAKLLLGQNIFKRTIMEQMRDISFVPSYVLADAAVPVLAVAVAVVTESGSC